MNTRTNSNHTAMKSRWPFLMIFAAALPSLFGGTWNYNFMTQGFDTNYWSFQNNYANYGYSWSSGVGVTVSGGSRTDIAFKAGKLSLNLAQFPSLDDFSASVTFTGLTLTGGVHQVQLEVWGAGNTKVVLNDRSNQLGQAGVTGGNSVNFYDGSSEVGNTAVSALGLGDTTSGITTSGTLSLARSGSTYYSSWNGVQFWSGSYWGDTLSAITISSQNNWWASDATSVTFQSFSLSSSAIPEPSTYAAVLAVGALLLAIWRRRVRS